MPGTSTSVNPHGIGITFTEENHRYSSIINGKELIYESVSSLAGRYFPKFDMDTMAPLTAKKTGKTVEEVKMMWKQAGIDACTMGTRVHESCEDTILGRPLRNSPQNERERMIMENGIRMAERFKNELEILDVEKLVFNEKIGIAGTIDLLAKSRKDGSYLILDWKTNKSIDVENKFGKKGFGPAEGLDDTNFEHYSLQLALYEFILRNTGYVPKDSKFKRAIIHLAASKPEIMLLPDRLEYAKNIVLEHILTH